MRTLSTGAGEPAADRAVDRVNSYFEPILRGVATRVSTLAGLGPCSACSMTLRSSGGERWSARQLGFLVGGGPRPEALHSQPAAPVAYTLMSIARGVPDEAPGPSGKGVTHCFGGVNWASGPSAMRGGCRRGRRALPSLPCDVCKTAIAMRTRDLPAGPSCAVTWLAAHQSQPNDGAH